MNKLAIVTGASSGIGHELAIQFAKNGYDLLVVAEQGKIQRTEETLQKLGVEVEGLQCDLATLEGVEQLCNRIQELDRPVDAIAINAGVGVNGKITDTSFAEELNMINLNITYAVYLSKFIAKYMIEKSQGGKILFTSSIAATAPAPYMAVYAATKAFLFSFAEALRYELKENGISVTALLPGPTATDFFHRADMEDTKVGASEKDSPAEVARQGFEALMDGKDHVIAGSLKTRIGNAANDMVPETVKAARHSKMTKPGSANN